MAEIDRFLRALTQPGNPEVFLNAGKVPVVFNGGKFQPLAATVLSSADVLRIVREIAGPAAAAVNGGGGDFVYDSADAGRVAVAVRIVNGEAKSKFVKENGAAAKSATPAAVPAVPAPAPLPAPAPAPQVMPPAPAPVPLPAPAEAAAAVPAPPLAPSSAPPAAASAAPMPAQVYAQNPYGPHMGGMPGMGGGPGMMGAPMGFAPMGMGGMPLPPHLWQQLMTLLQNQQGSQDPQGAAAQATASANEAIDNLSSEQPGGQHRIIDLLSQAKRMDASDFHLVSGKAPMVRVGGILQPLQRDAIAADKAESILTEILAPRYKAILQRDGSVDFSYARNELGRCRVNVSRGRGGLNGTFRLIPPQVPEVSQLGLPPAAESLIAFHKGLTLVTGPTGAGKTTTLVALLNRLNMDRAQHIITVEDPIEHVLPRGRAVVSQREIGRHTRNFHTALKSALREDPDIIIIGEIRDRETVEIALEAAETGHFVLASMVASSATKAIERVIEAFPPDKHSQVRMTLSTVLRGVINQRLLPSVDGRRLILAAEILVIIPSIAALVRDDKVYQIPGAMERGRGQGMCLIEDSLVALARTGAVSEDAVLLAARDAERLRRMMGGRSDDASESPGSSDQTRIVQRGARR